MAVLSNDGIGGKPFAVKQYRLQDIPTDDLEALTLKPI